MTHQHPTAQLRTPWRAAARIGLAAASLLMLNPTWAQTAAPATAQAAAAAPVKDPKAMSALGAMSTYLRSLKQFAVRADTTTDEVLLTGQKLQFNGTASYQFVAPDRLRLDLRTDRMHRDIVFDGKTLTMVAPRRKLYASVPAPATTAELVTTAEREYGLSFPLADLFLWGNDQSALDAIKEASFIGPAKIAGQSCDQYAFRQDGVDWQLWIRQGAQPLPCKIVITTKGEPEQPQFSAQLAWNLAARPAASAFKYTPPADARRIQMTRVSELATTK
jgi:hypothetical protein